MSLAHHMAFQGLFKAVASVRGTPSLLHFPIGTHHLLRMLSLVGLSGSVSSGAAAVLVACVGTVTCCRPSEVANMQQCYLLWNLNAAYQISLVGGLGIRINGLRQDIKRFGLYTRLPPGALKSLLRAFVQESLVAQGRIVPQEEQAGSPLPIL